MNFETLVKARKVLDPIWKRSWLRGRCWGPKKLYKRPYFENPFIYSNIIIAFESELVSISQESDGNLRIHEFRKMPNKTKLGKKIREILKENGLEVDYK
jgi:hypothetical protein